MRAIETLEGLPTKAAQRLRQSGIESVDDLWSRLAQRDSQDEFRLQLASVAMTADLPTPCLLALLAEEAVHEDRWGDYARLGAGGPKAIVRWCQDGLRELRKELGEIQGQSLRAFLGRQWLDVAVATLVILCLGLFGAYRLVPVVHSQREAVLVSQHDLEAGQVLEPGDWVESRWLPVTDDRLPASADPTNWRTAHKIPGGQPLRYQDLERDQVVALNDIAAGAVLDSDSVELAPSKATATALLDSASIVGQHVRQKITAGTVLTRHLLRAPPPRVVAKAWLPAFRVIQPGDVTLSPAEPPNDELLRNAEGRLTLRDLAPGEPVEGALLSVPVPPTDLADRKVMALESLAGDFQLRAGSRVSLYVTPEKTPQDAFTLADVLVLRAGGEAPTLVALPPDEFTRLMPWFGRAKIAAFQTISLP